MRDLVERLQDGRRRPRMRQTNFWLGDDLNERLSSAVAIFGARSKSHLVRVLLEDGLERLGRDAGEASPSGAWSVEIDTEHETARLLMLSSEKVDAVAVLEEWLNGQPQAEFDRDAMRAHDGARVLFLERHPRESSTG